MSLRILISGAHGLIGSALRLRLLEMGHQPIRLSRSAGANQPQAQWDPDRGQINLPDDLALDAAVHLAGEPIANGRWSAAKKARIRASRVQGTTLLVKALARISRPPSVFLCASAVGVYGDRGDEELTETSPAGTGFLAEVGKEWEAAAETYTGMTGARVCRLRFGVVLSTKGGALQKMLPAFKLGIGGRLGGGKQWMSWISLNDALGAILHALTTPTLRGPVNVVAPFPVRNAAFTRALAAALKRPAFFPVPAAALRLLFGELADAALLSSQRALPKALLESGFVFTQPEIEGALREILT